MKWRIELNGKSWTREEAGERGPIIAGFREGFPDDTKGWEDLARLTLERLGVTGVLKLADFNLWRQALSETKAISLPPSKLPLAIWEAYRVRPYARFWLHFKGGSKILLNDWSAVYFCWHDGGLGLLDHDGLMRFFDVEDVVRVETLALSKEDEDTAQQLIGLCSAPQFEAFKFRTALGNGYLVAKPSRLKVQPGESHVAVHMGEYPIEFVRVSEIVSVALCKNESASLSEQLGQRLLAVPFRSFTIRFCGGAEWPIEDPRNLWVTSSEVTLMQNGPGSRVVATAGIDWIDRILTTTPSTEAE